LSSTARFSASDTESD